MITFKAINRYVLFEKGKEKYYYKLTFLNGEFKILTEEDWELIKQEAMCDVKDNLS